MTGRKVTLMIIYDANFEFVIKEDFTLALAKAMVGKLKPTELLKKQPYLRGQDNFGAKGLTNLAYLMACNMALETGNVGTFVANQNRYVLDSYPNIGTNYYYLTIDLGVKAAKSLTFEPSEELKYYPASRYSFKLIKKELCVLAGIIEITKKQANTKRWLADMCEDLLKMYNAPQKPKLYFEAIEETCFRLYTF